MSKSKQYTHIKIEVYKDLLDKHSKALHKIERFEDLQDRLIAQRDSLKADKAELVEGLEDLNEQVTQTAVKRNPYIEVMLRGTFVELFRKLIAKHREKS